MDSIEKLIRFYNKTDENDMYHNVTGCLLQNLRRIGEVSIYDMADLCYSSTSTLSRLIKKLDFPNYMDFKSRIGHALENYHDLNRNMRDMDFAEDRDVMTIYFNFLINNLLSLKDDLDYNTIAAVSDSFSRADEIYLYSFHDVQIHALQKDLIVSGKKAYVCSSIPQAENSLDKIRKQSVVFAVIPNLMEMSPVRGILKKAAEQGAFVISVCSDKQNHYKKYSDIQITFTGTKTSMDLYLFQTIMNILRNDYQHRYLNAVLEDFYG